MAAGRVPSPHALHKITPESVTYTPPPHTHTHTSKMEKGSEGRRERGKEGGRCVGVGVGV